MRSRKVKKGSALVMVLVIFMVVSITGMALLGTALQNYTNRSLTAKSKFNLYMSSSGIDEAYAIINDYVEEAVKYSNLETDKLVDEIINKDKEVLDKLFKLNNLNDKTDEQKTEITALIASLKFYDVEGNAKFEELKNYRNDLFKKCFYGYFDNSDTSFSVEKADGTNTIIKDKGNIQKLINDIKGNPYKLSEKDNPINVQIKNSSELKINKIEEAFNILLLAKFEDHKIEKEIMAEVQVTSPEYDSNTAISRNYINLIKNPVWSKPIVVGKNLEVKGGSLDVTGGVYAQGTDKQGGVVISDKSSELNIKGDLITSESFIFNYDNDNNDGSTAEIVGNAYVRNLIVEKNEDSHAQGAKISIKKSADKKNDDEKKNDGSIYVLDDMEINADKSTINIGGSYYGISNGSDSEENEVDHSSAININCDDLGGDNGTSLKIGENLYLAGTAYISGLKDSYGLSDYKYQTGESIAIKGNYKAYSKKLIHDKKIFKGDGTKENSTDNVVFRYFNPLKLVSDYNTHKAWWNLKENHGQYKLTVGLTHNGKKQYPTAYKFTAYVKKQEEKIPLNDKNVIGEEVIITSDNAQKLLQPESKVTISFDKNKMKLETDLEIPAQRIDEEIEGFIHSTKDDKTNIIIDMTPYGELKNKEAGYYRISGSTSPLAVIGEYLEVNSSDIITEGVDTDRFLNVDILDINKSLIKDNIRVNLKKLNLDNLNWYAKSQYFKYYAEDYEDDINKGKGIHIGYKLEEEEKDFIHAGIIFDNNNLLDSNYLSNKGESSEKEYKFRIKKLQLKDKLFYMDFLEKASDMTKCKEKYKQGNDIQVKEIQDIDDISKEDGYKSFIKEACKDYKENILKPYITINGLINFGDERIADTDEMDNILILDGSDEKNYDIIGSGGKATGTANEKINISEGKGIIITKGDIHIHGEVNFQGVIITSGNLFIEDGAKLNILYKEETVDMLMARNYDKLKDIFKIKNSFNLDSEKVDIYDIENSDGDKDKDKPVVIKKWGIVK